MRFILLGLAILIIGCQAPVEVKTVPTPPTEFTVQFNVFDEAYQPIDNLTVLLILPNKDPIPCDYEFSTVSCRIPSELFNHPANFIFLAPKFITRYMLAPRLKFYLSAIRMQHLPYPTYDPLSRKELL